VLRVDEKSGRPGMVVEAVLIRLHT
jgi:hypothetical protein